MRLLRRSMLYFLLGFFCLFFIQVEAASVRLYNDTSYSLKAIIRGADGSQLGEAVLSPQTYYNWSDAPSKAPKEQPKANPSKSNTSRTPYTVIWYCMDGSDFSMADNVATGAFTTALHGSGKKTCGSPTPPASPNNSPKVKP